MNEVQAQFWNDAQVNFEAPVYEVALLAKSTFTVQAMIGILLKQIHPTLCFVHTAATQHLVNKAYLGPPWKKLTEQLNIAKLRPGIKRSINVSGVTSLIGN